MDTRRLEKFAQSARRQLHEQVAARLDRVLTTDSAELRAKEKTIKELKEQIAASSRISEPRRAVVEKVAYTWFNRFCALRYMDVNHYTRMGTVSPATSPTGEAFTQPEILQEAKQGVIDERFRRTVDARTVSGLLSGQLPSSDPQQEAYRLLLVGVCNAYHACMPFMFEKIDDYTELLMPDDLLSEGSILQAVREALTVENCADVEVIGWLYQFYISEKKDEVMARKGAVPSEDIPAVTQLFTPHWIVRYMVENSLGRLWMLNHPDSRLIERMDYYIAPEQKITDFLRVTSPEEIRLCDPAAGSGHILTYAFDLLYAIYEEQGYNPIDIPRLILEKNLTGLEIDPRAGALAGFALMMKAREKDARFFRRNVQPDICVLEDVTFTPQEMDAYMDAVGHDLFTQNVRDWLGQFEQATTFGSLIRPLVTDTAFIRERLDEAGVFQNLFLSHTHDKLRAVLRMSEALSSRYHVVVANPPYMGGKNMNAQLKAFLKINYNDFKSDLFAAFIVRIMKMAHLGGFIGMMTPFTWMSLSSYEKLRIKLLNQSTLTSLVRPEYHAFFESAYVPVCAFVLFTQTLDDFEGSFIDLEDFYGAEEQSTKTLEAIKNPKCGWVYRAPPSDFRKIPGSPIAYSISAEARSAFVKFGVVSDVANAKQGLITGHNDRFLRYWTEVNLSRIGFGFHNRQAAQKSQKRWFPHHKGGPYRKWYGNHEYVVDWENDGFRIRNFRDERGKLRSRPQNMQYYFKPAITWTALTVASFNGRLSHGGFIYDAKGPILAPRKIKLLPLLAGLLNSSVSNYFLKLLAPTMDYNQGPVSRLPFAEHIIDESKQITYLVQRLEVIAKNDWDSKELSWDFAICPLLSNNFTRDTFASTYTALRTHWQKITLETQRLEQENNCLFIDAYGLQDELSPEVPLNEITLTCNPYYRYSSSRLKKRSWAVFCEQFPETCQQLADISAEMASDMPEEDRLGLEQRLLDDTMREFVSYAVGCMFGRYSLDRPGLILANQGETLDDYLRQVPDPTFMPDEDNVIAMLDGDWFPDDVSERFKAFLKVTFGGKHYEENLAFVEAVIGRDVRSYFLRNFYDDHVKTYNKRPIYWRFSSPKGSFNALVYMHRYRPDTASIVLNDYLREFRTKLTGRRRHLEHVERSAATTQRDKAQAVKEIAKIDKILNELRAYEDQVLYPLATQQVEIDLDDGVKVNYNKLGQALAHVRGLSEKKRSQPIVNTME
jgi:type II restriction/modification system DNA methylase subunit YeeA